MSSSYIKYMLLCYIADFLFISFVCQLSVSLFLSFHIVYLSVFFMINCFALTDCLFLLQYNYLFLDKLSKYVGSKYNVGKNARRGRDGERRKETTWRNPKNKSYFHLKSMTNFVKLLLNFC